MNYRKTISTAAQYLTYVQPVVGGTIAGMRFLITARAMEEKIKE